MIVLFINFYIDKNRSPHGGCKNLLWPIVCAKYYDEVYVYQGIKKTINIKDGKLCKINKDGSNSIIDGDPNNKCQQGGSHSKWDYPNTSSKFSNILLNSDIIFILSQPAKKDYFQPELNNSKAFIVQQPIYSDILKITDYVLKNDEIVKSISDDILNVIKKYRTTDKSNNYNIGLVGNIDPRKGQLDFLNQIDSNKVSKYTFHIVGPIYSGDYYKQIINVCQEKNINYKMYGKLEHEEYFKTLCGFKCVVHYSRLDANPRVIWDTIYSGVPYFASEKCEIPKIIHNLGVISNNINRFYDLLEIDYQDKIINYTDKKLNVDSYFCSIMDDIIHSDKFKEKQLKKNN